jgi:hypothetical protein
MVFNSTLYANGSFMMYATYTHLSISEIKYIGNFDHAKLVSKDQNFYVLLKRVRHLKRQFKHTYILVG